MNLSQVEDPVQILKSYSDGYDYIGKPQYQEMDTQEPYAQNQYSYI